MPSCVSKNLNRNWKLNIGNWEKNSLAPQNLRLDLGRVVISVNLFIRIKKNSSLSLPVLFLFSKSRRFSTLYWLYGWISSITSILGTRECLQEMLSFGALQLNHPSLYEVKWRGMLLDTQSFCWLYFYFRGPHCQVTATCSVWFLSPLAPNVGLLLC